jgi:osmoprotectant transport system ATP-binding protein
VSQTLIRFERVTKRFGAHVALEDVSIDVSAGELLVVIGRSGSGKTTMLRCVNALVVPDAGRVLVEGRSAESGDVVASRRRIGYVIQSGGLFSHMTVGRNVAILGRATGDTVERRAARVAEVLAAVGLEALESRYPSELSGGQRQRVGIARALYMDPPILLLDEPFAAVDPLTRMELQDEFSRLHRRLRKTMVFVTHDVDEALYLGDRIAVFDAGRLVQIDAPDDLRRNPATEYIARFLQRRRARGDL